MTLNSTYHSPLYRSEERMLLESGLTVQDSVEHHKNGLINSWHLFLKALETERPKIKMHGKPMSFELVL